MVKRAPKIIFVPGWTYKVDKNLPLVEQLRKNGSEVKVLLVPGLTGEELTRAWDLDDYVKWLEKQLLGEEKVILLGHSNGGRIILQYLAEMKGKGKAEKVILLDSAGIIDQTLAKKLKRKVGKVLAQTGKKLVKKEGWRKILYKILRERDYVQATPVMRETMANLLQADLREKLPGIAQQILLIWGSDDKVTPLYLGREMAAMLPEAELAIIKGARHTPQFTHPNEVVKLIEGFIDGKI